MKKMNCVLVGSLIGLIYLALSPVISTSVYAQTIELKASTHFPL